MRLERSIVIAAMGMERCKEAQIAQFVVPGALLSRGGAP